jgi:hypothetical protein
MDDPRRQACIDEIRRIWTQSGAASRPPGVWIAEHGPVTPANAKNDCSYASPVLNAWLLDDHGVARRDPQHYVRFMTVQLGLYWASGAPPRGIFSNTGAHPVGLAGFAPITGSDLTALHYIWGGLCGAGSHYHYDRATRALECVANIWRS